MILGMGSSNQRRRYIVTPPLIGWTHTENDPLLEVPMYVALRQQGINLEGKEMTNMQCKTLFVRVLRKSHYTDVIMSVMASQITSLTIVYLTVYPRRRSKKNQSSASLAFVRGIHRSPVNSPHKGPVTRKMFPFDGVIMVEIHVNMTIQSWLLIGWQHSQKSVRHHVSQEIRRTTATSLARYEKTKIHQTWCYGVLFFRVTGPLWGHSPVIGGFRAQRVSKLSFLSALIWAWTNCWTNNRVSSGLRRHYALVESL